MVRTESLDRMRSQVIVGATLVVDAALFLALLSVGLASGSRAVLSQAIYVVSDLIGAGLLSWGIIASMRPPDEKHPFGRGKERFFWSFSASLVTFTLAGFIVILTGLASVAHPTEVTDLRYVFLVLGLTVVSSAIGILVTLRELSIGHLSLSEFLESSNLGLKTIFYQDLVSVFGAVVALLGIVFIEVTHRPIFDGLAAIGVGVLLLVTGVLLAAESRELLVGKAISPGEARKVLQLVERDARVRKVRGLQSMMLGPEDILVALRVNFQDGLTTDQIEGAIDQIAASLRETFPMMRHLLIEPES
jgi:cation diffusion facilitator family transporter